MSPGGYQKNCSANSAKTWVGWVSTLFESLLDSSRWVQVVLLVEVGYLIYHLRSIVVVVNLDVVLARVLWEFIFSKLLLSQSPHSLTVRNFAFECCWPSSWCWVSGSEADGFESSFSFTSFGISENFLKRSSLGATPERGTSWLISEGHVLLICRPFCMAERHPSW